MNLNIVSTNVIPHLDPASLDEVVAAANRLQLGDKSDKDVRAAMGLAHAHNPETGHCMDAVGSLACGLELKGRHMARFIVSEGWRHYFENNRESLTRWVLEKETGFVLFAQVMGRHGWRPATRMEKEDLAESLIDANEMLTRAHEYDVTLMRDLPSWTAKEVN